MNNSEYISHLYQNLQNLGLVHSQDDFSRLCGRAPNYISSLKARNIPLSTSAALALRMRISQRITDDMPRRLKPLAREITNSLDEFAQSRSMQRDWQ